jgi:hypothetical protein
MPTRQRIDRITDHTCPGLERDIAYFANIGQAYFHCVNCNATIPTQYVQFSMLCSACRVECTDDSDVEPATCNYCNQAI